MKKDAQSNDSPSVLRTISVLVDNASGVLSQVSRLFSRKGYNIESLAVGTTHDPAVSRITVEVRADDARTALLCNQLRKLLPVHSVRLLDRGRCVRRELVLIKVKAAAGEAADRVVQIAGIFRAHVIDVSPATLTLSVIGEEGKTAALVGLLEEFGILELVRTGMVALARGGQTIYDKTKESGEFDVGKHVG